jgi:hypothetical protein
MCSLEGRPEGRNVGRRAGGQRGQKEGRKKERKDGMKLLAVEGIEIDWRWWAPPVVHSNERLV